MLGRDEGEESVDKPNEDKIENQAGEIWIKPEVTSFAPVKAAEGLSYTNGDGLSNLTA